MSHNDVRYYILWCSAYAAALRIQSCGVIMSATWYAHACAMTAYAQDEDEEVSF